jgi:hypothetical protein
MLGRPKADFRAVSYLEIQAFDACAILTEGRIALSLLLRKVLSSLCFKRGGSIPVQ